MAIANVTHFKILSAFGDKIYGFSDSRFTTYMYDLGAKRIKYRTHVNPYQSSYGGYSSKIMHSFIGNESLISTFGFTLSDSFASAAVPDKQSRFLYNRKVNYTMRDDIWYTAFYMTINNVATADTAFGYYDEKIYIYIRKPDSVNIYNFIKTIDAEDYGAPRCAVQIEKMVYVATYSGILVFKIINDYTDLELVSYVQASAEFLAPTPSGDCYFVEFVG